MLQVGGEAHARRPGPAEPRRTRRVPVGNGEQRFADRVEPNGADRRDWLAAVVDVRVGGVAGDDSVPDGEHRARSRADHARAVRFRLHRRRPVNGHVARPLAELGLARPLVRPTDMRDAGWVGGHPDRDRQGGDRTTVHHGGERIIDGAIGRGAARADQQRGGGREKRDAHRAILRCLASPRDHTSALRLISSRYQSADNLGVRLPVAKSTWWTPNRLPYPSAHSKLSIRLHRK